jgi:protein arginine N-methyltransferase 1
MRYDGLIAHRAMLRDSERTERFAKAIEAVVRPRHVVLDVGAGSGILSLLAARAGASRVYAVERTPIASLAADLAQLNGYGETVFVIQADIQQVPPPEKVDVIVSEWLGAIGVDENLLAPVLIARDAWLKSGGTMIPSAVRTFMAPAELRNRPDAGFFRNRPYGLDLSPLAEPSIHDLFWQRRHVRPEDLAADPAELWSVDIETAPLERAFLPWRGEHAFIFSRSAAVNVLVAWFEADLAPGNTLTTAPSAPDTHWGQLQIPLEEPIEVARGDRLDVRFATLPVGDGPHQLAWSVSHNGGRWTLYDTRALPTAPTNGTRPAATLATPAANGNGAHLLGFLAELAGNPDALHAFIQNPEQVLEASGLPEAKRAALQSGNELQIQQVLVTERVP